MLNTQELKFSKNYKKGMRLHFVTIIIEYKILSKKKIIEYKICQYIQKNVVQNLRVHESGAMIGQRHKHSR